MIQYTGEIWRQAVNERYEPIEGYEVSNAGRVKSLARTVMSKRGYATPIRGCIRKPVPKNGYLWVGLGVNGKKARFFIHRLVALAFPEICGKYEPGLEVDHISGDRMDNRPENLRFVTRSQNITNPNTWHNIHKNLEKAWDRNSVTVTADGLTQVFSTSKALADYLGVTPGRVSSALKQGGKIKGLRIMQK